MTYYPARLVYFDSRNHMGALQIAQAVKKLNISSTKSDHFPPGEASTYFSHISEISLKNRYCTRKTVPDQGVFPVTYRNRR